MTDKEPEIVYHYTSQNGLLGILDKKALRATDLLYLNDYSEVQHAIRIAQKEVGTLVSIGRRELYDAAGVSMFLPLTPHSEIGDLGTHDLSFLKDVAGMLEAFERHHIYTFSFSEEGDSLSQWKLYGSDFRGFSIGFGLSELEALGEGEGHFSIQKCLYDEAAQEEMIRGILTTALMEFRGHRDPSIAMATQAQLDEDRAHAANICRAMLLGNITRLKKSGFAPEKEWRIVRHYDQNYEKLNRSNPEFRESGLSLVPFELIRV
jgi:hypothetical protein